MLKFIQLMIIVAMLTSGAVSADVETDSSKARTSTTQISSQEQSEQHKAAQWGLDASEWQRFNTLMQGPQGIHSPNLDPLTALGIEARNEKELTRYAELQVQMETARITKLLAYQNAYDKAYKRLYPNLLPVTLVDTAKQPMASPLEVGNHLAAFVTAGCDACDAVIKKLQRDNQRFDIYLVGSKGNDDALRAWALKTGIQPDRVRSRQITLNHDAGRAQTLGIEGDFPAVLKHTSGKWVRQ